MHTASKHGDPATGQHVVHLFATVQQSAPFQFLVLDLRRHSVGRSIIRLTTFVVYEVLGFPPTNIHNFFSYDTNSSPTNVHCRACSKSLPPHTFFLRPLPQVYPDPHPDFMFSENLFEVAERGGCGYKRGSGFPLHFTKSFAKRPDDFPHYVYSTRRVWCVLIFG